MCNVPSILGRREQKLKRLLGTFRKSAMVWIRLRAMLAIPLQCMSLRSCSSKKYYCAVAAPPYACVCTVDASCKPYHLIVASQFETAGKVKMVYGYRCRTERRINKVYQQRKNSSSTKNKWYLQNFSTPVIITLRRMTQIQRN